MTPEELLRQTTATNRTAHQQRQTKQQQIQARQTPHAVALPYDADRGFQRIQLSDGSIREAESNSNGVIGLGNSVQLHQGMGRSRINVMPHKSRRIPTASSAPIPLNFTFYAAFNRFIATAIDTGKQALPIKSLIESNVIYSGTEPGFVSAKNGFLYTVGADLKTIHKINPTTLDSELILNIAAIYPSHLFNALCMGPNNTLFDTFRKNTNEGYLYRRTSSGAEDFFSLDTGGTQGSIATLDNETVYLVRDYYYVYKFNTLTNTLTTLRDFPAPDVLESTLFADNRHQSLYLFGIGGTFGQSYSLFWEVAPDGTFAEYYRFSDEFYRLPNRSAIADVKTRTIFMIGRDDSDKLIRIDRNKKRTDFVLSFDDPNLATSFDYFGQLDWIY